MVGVPGAKEERAAPRHAEEPQLSALASGTDVRHRREAHVDLSASRSVMLGGGALVGHVDDVDAVACLKSSPKGAADERVPAEA